MNSSLMAVYIEEEVTSYKRLFPQLNQRHLSELPIRRIDFSDATDREMHDRLVALVERMLELHRRKGDESLALGQREDIQRDIAATDREIDHLVYDLYGLTEEERRVVEDATR